MWRPSRTRRTALPAPSRPTPAAPPPHAARGFAIVAAILGLVVGGCARPPVVAARDVVIGVVGELGPLLGDDPVGAVVAGALIEPLVARSATEELEPRLAAQVPTFANGDLTLTRDETRAPALVATFRLRPGLTWHDGEPLTADDVAFAFELDRSSAIGSQTRALADRMEKVGAVDARTVRVTYKAGERWDLYALVPRALPRHLLARAGAAQLAQYAERPIHSGPYRVAERSPGTIVLEAFAGHVPAPPRIPRIVVRAYADRGALLNAVRAGEVDVAPSPAFDADLSQTLDRTVDARYHDVRYTQAQSIATLRFGSRLSDPLVREAVSLVVDRERIARTVFGGRARVPNTYLVAPLWAAADDQAPTRRDIETARALLAKAGYHKGDLGIAQREGDRLVVTLAVPSGSPALAEAARGVAVDIAAIGIAAQVSERPPAEVDLAVLRGTFDLAIEIERADDPLLATWRYRGAVSAWFDALADAAAERPDRSEQRALYVELQRLWTVSVPAVPLYQVLKVDVVSTRLDGVHPASHAAPITWDVAGWRLVRQR